VEGPTIRVANSEYVRGIPLPNNYKRKKIYTRFKHHSKSCSHILACSEKNAKGFKNEPEEPISLVSFFEENEAITIEPTEAEIENKRLEEENDEIGVKVEIHDSDDEPLTKIIKLS